MINDSVRVPLEKVFNFLLQIYRKHKGVSMLHFSDARK